MKNLILWSIVFILLILCLIRKQKIKILPLVLLTIAVTFFQLLTPNGKILFSAEHFHLTLGSLQSGLFKSGILILLQLFSKLIVSFKIKYPGKAGRFLTDVFFIYDKLTSDNFLSNEKSNFKNENPNSQIPLNKKSIISLINNLDKKLLSLWEQI